jgi:hypothetical protein
MFNNIDVFVEELAIKRGKIAGFEKDGVVLVESEEMEALLPSYFIRTTTGPLPRLNIGDEALFILDSGQERGYILGLIEPYRHEINAEDEKSETLLSSGEEVEIKLPGKLQNVRVNGKKIYIEADDEIHLKCGKSSIFLNRQGKIVVRGANLISRSSGMNKIKGAAVNIN